MSSLGGTVGTTGCAMRSDDIADAQGSRPVALAPLPHNDTANAVMDVACAAVASCLLELLKQIWVEDEVVGAANDMIWIAEEV